MSEFPDFRHHIILISNQNVPEFLAASLPAHHTVLLHTLITPQMTSQDARLGQLWRNRGGIYHDLPIRDMSTTEIHAALDKALASCQGETCAMNINGGTKLMTIATSWSVKIPLFYVGYPEQEDRPAGRDMAGFPPAEFYRSGRAAGPWFQRHKRVALQETAASNPASAQSG